MSFASGDDFNKGPEGPGGAEEPSSHAPATGSEKGEATALPTSDASAEKAFPYGEPRAAQPNFLTPTRFSDFALAPQIVEGLDAAGFLYATPIQAQVIPEASLGKDIAGQAQTGTGKTAAFIIPVMQRLLSKPAANPGTPRALIITPTRDMAEQIYREAKNLAQYAGLAVTFVIGGMDFKEQAAALGAGTDIVVGTPGRLIDFINKRVLITDGIEVFVVDDADRLVELGFIRDLKIIFSKLPALEERQTMLFAASLSHQVLELTQQHMKPPQFITAEPDILDSDQVVEKLYHVSRSDKLPLLLGLLAREERAQTLIFCNSRNSVEWLAKKLLAKGFRAEGVYGELPPPKRTALMKSLSEGLLDIIVATDVASRGVHLENVSHVVNFDMPPDAEKYALRVGRATREGKIGDAISFACEEYVHNLEAIENVLGKKIPVAYAPDEFFETEPPKPKKAKEFKAPDAKEPQGATEGEAASSAPAESKDSRGARLETKEKAASGAEAKENGREESNVGRCIAFSDRPGGIFGLAPRNPINADRPDFRINLTWTPDEIMARLREEEKLQGAPKAPTPAPKPDPAEAPALAPESAPAPNAPAPALERPLAAAAREAAFASASPETGAEASAVSQPVAASQPAPTPNGERPDFREKERERRRGRRQRGRLRREALNADGSGAAAAGAPAPLATPGAPLATPAAPPPYSVSAGDGRGASRAESSPRRDGPIAARPAEAPAPGGAPSAWSHLFKGSPPKPATGPGAEIPDAERASASPELSPTEAPRPSAPYAGIGDDSAPKELSRPPAALPELSPESRGSEDNLAKKSLETPESQKSMETSDNLRSPETREDHDLTIVTKILGEESMPKEIDPSPDSSLKSNVDPVTVPPPPPEGSGGARAESPPQPRSAPRKVAPKASKGNGAAPKAPAKAEPKPKTTAAAKAAGKATEGAAKAAGKAPDKARVKAPAKAPGETAAKVPAKSAAKAAATSAKAAAPKAASKAPGKATEDGAKAAAPKAAAKKPAAAKGEAPSKAAKAPKAAAAKAEPKPKAPKAEAKPKAPKAEAKSKTPKAPKEDPKGT
ncbi:MAG: DEAD/DEAH box helicase [Deltaproteobacteria bacterium]|jgi:ATP-dependent RNA helicase RhlB|nr:DEAD/DEAH box helicase [Deltaproteobacteria bacterium]